MGAGIRRVRTPAGARRFGRPIGAPILPGEGGPDLPGVAPAAAVWINRPPKWARRPHWTRGSDGSWLIHPGEEPILPGDLVEVHRRDGSSSWHVVGDQVGDHFRSARPATPTEVQAWRRNPRTEGRPKRPVRWRCPWICDHCGGTEKDPACARCWECGGWFHEGRRAEDGTCGLC
jgi:hypothetical protein